MREDTSPNYVVRAVESQLANVRKALRYRLEENPPRLDRVAELEAEEKQLASFLNFTTER
jgi:hypothetical protein